jgi:hypothetical protein
MFRKKQFLSVCAASLLCLLGAAIASAASVLPNISALQQFAVFGDNLNLSLVTINGNTGVSNGGSVHLFAPSVINGNLVLGTGATSTLDAPHYNNLITNVDLSTAESQLFAASAQLAGLSPDVTLSNLTSSQTVAGNGGVKVIDVTGNVSLNNNSLTLTGGVNDFFVVNVNGGFDLVGSGGIVAGSGIDASHVIVNIIGTGSTVTSHVGNEINATLLLPDRAAVLHSLNGAIYGGTQQITLMSGATVNSMPFAPPPLVPTPTALAAGLPVLLGLGLIAWKRRGSTTVA